MLALLPLTRVTMYEEHREHILEVRLVELLLAQEGIEPILVRALQSHDRVGGTADDDGSRSPAYARA
jgi:hypothetical protein